MPRVTAGPITAADLADPRRCLELYHWAARAGAVRRSFHGCHQWFTLASWCLDARREAWALQRGRDSHPGRLFVALASSGRWLGDDGHDHTAAEILRRLRGGVEPLAAPTYALASPNSDPEALGTLALEVVARYNAAYKQTRFYA